MAQSDVAKKANCCCQTIADSETGKSVTALTLLSAILSNQKQVQLCLLGIDLENIHTLLGSDWED